jgi:hypothetical protein
MLLTPTPPGRERTAACHQNCRTARAGQSGQSANARGRNLKSACGITNLDAALPTIVAKAMTNIAEAMPAQAAAPPPSPREPIGKYSKRW